MANPPGGGTPESWAGHEIPWLLFDESCELQGDTLVGRGPTPNRGEQANRLVVISDASMSVSKTHMMVRYDGSRVFVVDRHSTNGVAVENGGLVVGCQPGAQMLVPVSATIRFGDRSSVLVARPAGTGPPRTPMSEGDPSAAGDAKRTRTVANSADRVGPRSSSHKPALRRRTGPRIPRDGRPADPTDGPPERRTPDYSGY